MNEPRIDPEVFWKHLSHEDALAVRRAAPRIATPWKTTRRFQIGADNKTVPSAYERMNCPKSHVYAYQRAQGGPRYWYSPALRESFSFPDDALQAVDSYLRTSGWLLDQDGYGDLEL
jgi:hypothetical protein